MGWQQRVGEALDRLEPQMRTLAERLVSVPSVGGSPAEAEAQHVVAAWLTEHGVPAGTAEHAVDPQAPGFPGMEVPRSTVVEAVGRVSGAGSGPDLLLLGHTDVVPAADPAAFSPVWQGDRLIGRGASDMKAGVAAMCAAAAAHAASGVRLRGDLVVAAVSAEEDGGAGAYHLLRDPERLHVRPGSGAVIPEPTGMRVVSANAGCLTFRIRLPGRPAHGALRWQGTNPIDSLPTILQALRTLEEDRCRDADPRFGNIPLAYPISIGTIRGGDWASTVPEEVTVTGRYGVRLGESLDEARTAFASAVAAACRTDPWLAQHPADVTWWGAQFASASTADHESIVGALHAAGATPGVQAAPYGSDLRLVVDLAGLPTVQFGPGRPEQAHTTDEEVAWGDVVACARILALTAGDYCGVIDPAVDNPND